MAQRWDSNSCRWKRIKKPSVLRHILSSKNEYRCCEDLLKKEEAMLTIMMEVLDYEVRVGGIIKLVSDPYGDVRIFWIE